MLSTLRDYVYLRCTDETKRQVRDYVVEDFTRCFLLTMLMQERAASDVTAILESGFHVSASFGTGGPPCECRRSKPSVPAPSAAETESEQAVGEEEINYSRRPSSPRDVEYSQEDLFALDEGQEASDECLDILEDMESNEAKPAPKRKASPSFYNFPETLSSEPSRASVRKSSGKRLSAEPKRHETPEKKRGFMSSLKSLLDKFRRKSPKTVEPARSLVDALNDYLAEDD